jgi:hypothetical protein
MRRPWRAAYCGPSVLGLQSAVSAGLAASCLTHSAMLDGFRKLGDREGLPPLPDSELALFTGQRAQSKLMQQLTTVVHGYFASPANTSSQAALR